MIELTREQRLMLLERAEAAEELAIAARICLARNEWNFRHPDSKPLKMERFFNKAHDACAALAESLLEMPILRCGNRACECEEPR